MHTLHFVLPKQLLNLINVYDWLSMQKTTSLEDLWVCCLFEVAFLGPQWWGVGCPAACSMWLTEKENQPMATWQRWSTNWRGTGWWVTLKGNKKDTKSQFTNSINLGPNWIQRIRMSRFNHSIFLRILLISQSDKAHRNKGINNLYTLLHWT